MSAHDYAEFYVGGRWRAAGGGQSLPVIEAATEAPLGSVPNARREDIDAAVDAARRAQGTWSAMTASDRSEAIGRFADAVEHLAEEVAALVSRQNGMPLRLSRFLEGRFPVELLRYYAELAQSTDDTDLRESTTNRTVVRRSGVGVVAAIVPWNYPVTLAVSKIAPALASGSTVVVKPTPATSLDSYLLARAAGEAELPPGVINWVPADREIGAYLVSHPGVDKVSFTGSTGAGRSIAAACGSMLRPVSLELGGKSAAIVLEDADLTARAADFFSATLANNGQTCVSCSRILAPRSRYEEVVEFVADLAGNAVVGDPLDRQTTIGPLASAEHRERVEGYIGAGVAEGARLVAGGRRPPAQSRGWFIEPTVFADVDNASTIGREEIFGPVLGVIPYDDERDAVRIANDSIYGLGGSVWSADIDHAHAVAERIETGTIGVNGYAIDLRAPFGGVKASGTGREFGPEGLASYQRLQSIYFSARS